MAHRQVIILAVIFLIDCFFSVSGQDIPPTSTTTTTKSPPDITNVYNEIFEPDVQPIKNDCDHLNKFNQLTLLSKEFEFERKLWQLKINRLRNDLNTCKSLLLTCVGTFGESSEGGSGSTGVVSLSSGDARNCRDIQERGYTKSGIYVIRPTADTEPINVYCDMDTLGGGWTYFQHRFNGKVDFYRNYDQYVNGFGDSDGEFWLGLEKLYKLTFGGNEVNELLIELTDKDYNKLNVRFNKFGISSKSEGYALTQLEGCIPDSECNSFLDGKGQKFTTYDKDQDSYAKNCAVEFYGGWWYNKCHQSNLNGKYHVGHTAEFATAMVWNGWKGFHEGMKETKMMVRPLKQ